ncbi:hypothetical protein CGRA01v4_00911 [Colletotrichum graminicola]|nr:hypothetical protein CGRA01v4_00911 [Colletotrichum graminicola]
MPLVVASWAEEEGLCSEVNVRTVPSCSPKAFPMPGRCLVSTSRRPCPALPRPLARCSDLPASTVSNHITAGSGPSCGTSSFTRPFSVF